MSLLAQKYPWSKWWKHVALWKDSSLRMHLPETSRLDSSNLHVYLRKYPVVFVKPCFGGGGRGILKLSRQGQKCSIQTVERRYQVPIEHTYKFVRKLTGSKSCIVQQGIDLMDVEGRSIDFRVLLLKPKEEWKLMGIMGKLGAPGRIVTNHCRGGSSITLKEALKRGTEKKKEEEQDMVQKEMEDLAQQIAQVLHKKYKLITELGLDMALDRKGKLWLIEANTRPQYNLFKDHEDRKLYRKIDETIRQLRRTTAS